ncbi:hypothetical protein HHK36_010744 [Tetracentron sinense]|uniref:Smr domain-containing protein n=1 Tax=Tetracentron sinense TaxID=13715 RepID=A0A834ZBK1_TETSI|nr:hypothetical protein HHK36_010744 [Tetracentron sinense]
MKSPKKKKRVRDSRRVDKDVAGDEKNEERRVLNWLIEAFSSASLDEAALAYREAKGDANKAAGILGGLLDKGEDPPTSSSSSSCSVSSSSESFFTSDVAQNPIRAKGFRENKQKRVVASAGTVSTVLGKDYLMSFSKKGSPKSKGLMNVPARKDDAEQFLCSMLGDSCELSMAVVRDVLCQCGYDVEKALEALLDLSASPYEQFKMGGCGNYSENDKQDRRLLTEYSDSVDDFVGKYQLTDVTSDSTSHSSENELQEILQCAGYNRRFPFAQLLIYSVNVSLLDEMLRYSQDFVTLKYAEVLSSKENSLSRPRITKSAIPQKVLEYLFNIRQSPEHEPSSMNWRNVVKKMESLGQGLDFRLAGTGESQQNTEHAKGDEYRVLRKSAKQHWESMKSCYEKAATAYSKGDRGYAAHLSDQGKFHNKLAREADEIASREIFEARNKTIENVITIDFHGQHVKQAMRLLKGYLLFGTYIPSVQFLRVITGCGRHGVGKGKLKQAVISLLEKERIGWSEENQGTVVIRLDGQREFSFLESETDSD